MSVEDWRDKTDILRCNSSFHNRPRYDCVVINTNPVTFGRLEYVFSCEDAEGQKCDLALVRKFEDSCWRPKTKWEGCRVLREKGEIGFLRQNPHISSDHASLIFTRFPKDNQFSVLIREKDRAISAFRTKTKSFPEEKESLKDENKSLRNENDSLKNENQSFKKMIESASTSLKLVLEKESDKTTQSTGDTRSFP
ncbi:hypothetical protein M422DRAFT_247050 [Sphaerobolus stellatus SS14]|nr:hypothetical protein M422DRAFT_247050 [Sphaerobolus stellatus SS14]